MEYAQARMQARHGERPNAARWRQLGSYRDFADYLAAVRGTGLARWVSGIDPSDGPHAIERTLRRHWRAACVEVGRWLPPEWRAATEWAAVLIDLPTHAHLARGGLPPGWLVQDSGRADTATLAAPGTKVSGGYPMIDRQAWLAAWQARWPTMDTEQAQELQRLAERIEEHLVQLAEVDPAGAGRARHALEQWAGQYFRACAGRPPAAFGHLLLQALDLEHLRAELLNRALQRRHPS
jgi:hypothetical protein